MRISDWSSDVCSSDLHPPRLALDDRQEAMARFGVGLVVHVLTRPDIAEDGGERRAQLVARIGDEVRPPAVGRVDRRPVGKDDDSDAYTKCPSPSLSHLPRSRTDFMSVFFVLSGLHPFCAS